ncbi:MAG: acyltransferase [Clostridia bacterium]|nr:acyltransferase [Clostridia bacterium]
MMGKERIGWIDSLRGVAMVFVIYGHICPSFQQFFLFTSPVKIPLFFVVSGYLFKSDIPPFQKMKKLFVSILVPYFFLSLFPFKLAASFLPLTGLQTADVLRQFFSGDYLWYLPCCFIAELIFYFITRYIYAKREPLVILICLAFTAAGLVLSKTSLGNFLYISNAMIAQFYLLMGYEMKKHEAKLESFSNRIVIFLTILYIIIGCFSMKLLPGQNLSARENHYYNIPLCFLMITLGCFTAITAFRKWDINFKPLSFIGKNTLAYYAFSKYFLSPVIYIFSLIGISLKVTPFIGIILTAVCCMACAPISLFLNKFFPFSVAKRKPCSVQKS